jgi:hypothetical protein
MDAVRDAAGEGEVLLDEQDRMTPKMSESPPASRQRSAPYDRPLKACEIQNSAVT